MISYLQGKIIIKKEKFVVLDVNNVGYKVFLSQKSLSKIPEIGQNLKLFCYLNVKENALDLYGFFDEKELDFFEVLNEIHGIGPKAALEISSLGSLEKIKDRILAQDEKLFEGIHGIGKKKAMAIILELSGRLQEALRVQKTHKENNPAGGQTGSDEAENALTSLGFPRQKAKEALSKVSKTKDSESRVKEALKILGKN